MGCVLLIIWTILIIILFPILLFNSLNFIFSFVISIVIYLLGILLYYLFVKHFLLTVKKEDIICLDLETTGTNIRNDEILQVSIIDGNYKVLFNTLIKPNNRKRWNDAMNINHITPPMIEQAPCMDDIKGHLENIIRSHKVIIGYNVENFDIPFINKYIHDESLYYFTTIIDIMDIFSRCVVKEWSNEYRNYKKQSLDDCCEYYNVINENAHDSLSDTIATLKCFYSMINSNINVGIKILD